MSINTAAPKIPTTLPGSLTPEAISVRGALLERGLETPMTANDLSRDQRYDVIRDAFGDIMKALGLDLRDDSLEETPHRIAKMYVDEVFSGLDYSKFPKITVIENKMNVEEMVCVEDIDLTSTCEHHFVTIDGSAKVAYIPKDKVIGLSKINRLVRFSHRDRRFRSIDPANLGGHADPARHRGCGRHHFCRTTVKRGVKDGNSSTRTTSLGGVFKSDPSSRAEFLS